MRSKQHRPEVGPQKHAKSDGRRCEVRVVDVVDLMRLQPSSEHPHGLTAADFDDPFTRDRSVAFAYHAYPGPIHPLTYRHTNHLDLHVRSDQEEGTITTTFDLMVLNELDRCHLATSAIVLLPATGCRGLRVKQLLEAKPVEHRRDVDTYGQDLPEIRDWT